MTDTSTRSAVPAQDSAGFADAAGVVEPLVPLVCGRCSSIRYVPVSLLLASKSLTCANCGAHWDAGAVAATVPRRMVGVDRERAPSSRPLSEFP